MIMTNKHLENKLFNTKTTLDILTSDEIIKTDIGNYGYADTHINTTAGIHESLESLYFTQMDVRGERYKHKEMVDQEFEATRGRYVNFRNLITATFFDRPELVKELKLKGAASQTLPTFYNQAKSFYQTCIKKPGLLAEVDTTVLSVEMLQTELDRLERLMVLHKEHRRLVGEDQRLQVERNKLEKNLDKHMKSLKSVLMLTYGESNPQTLERLGIFVRNNPKPKKNDTDTEPATDPGTEPATDPGTEPATDPGSTEPTTEPHTGN